MKNKPQNNPQKKVTKIVLVDAFTVSDYFFCRLGYEPDLGKNSSIIYIPHSTPQYRIAIFLALVDP